MEGKKYCVIFERVMKKSIVVGPFDRIEEAEAYAKAHHARIQIWHVGEFYAPGPDAENAVHA